MEKWYRDTPCKKTEFSNLQDEYYLAHNGELALCPEPKDCQAEIDSYRESSLESALDMLSSFSFGSKYQVSNSDYVDEVVKNNSKLDILLEADEIIETAKRDYNLDGYSRQDVVRFIHNKAKQSFEEYKNGKSDNDTMVVSDEPVSQTIKNDE